MEMPSISGAKANSLILAVVFLMAASYLVFLWGTWNQFQTDRVNRDHKLDEFLDRAFPKKAEEKADDA